MICIYFVVLVRQPLGHPQKASLGHHFEVRPYTSFLKKKYHFGVDHFQVPPRHLQRFLKIFFWGGTLCTHRFDSVLWRPRLDWLEDALRTSYCREFYFGVGACVYMPWIDRTVKNQSGRPKDKCREGGGGIGRRALIQLPEKHRWRHTD